MDKVPHFAINLGFYLYRDTSDSKEIKV